MAPERSAAAIRDAFLSGRRSAGQITADCLARATAAQRFNVFSRVLETEALAAARALDRRLAAGWPCRRWPGCRSWPEPVRPARPSHAGRRGATAGGRARRAGRGRAAGLAGRRRGAHRPDAYGRACLRRDGRECDRRRGAQSLGSFEDNGRLIGGHGRRDRGRRGPAGPGLRHQWLDSRAGCVLRHLGLASGHWPPVHARLFSLCGKPGCGGADGGGRRPSPWLGGHCAAGRRMRWSVVMADCGLSATGPASRSMPSRKPGTRCCAWRQRSRPRA